MRLLFLTPAFCALVKFAMAPKLSLWVRTVPPAVLPLFAMMAAIPLVCGLTLSGFGPIWHAATMLAALLLECGLALVGLGPIWFAATLVTLMESMALLKGLALAREDVDVPGAVSMVDAALCETAYEDALFGAAAPVALESEIVGVLAVPSVGVLMPDFKNHSSRVCVSLSADHLCSPVGSMHNSGTWNLPAAIACAFCFQSLLAAMLAACFYVPGLLFKGMVKDGCKKRKTSSSFLPGRDLPQASCLIRVEGHSAVASAELEEGHESFNNIIGWRLVTFAWRMALSMLRVSVRCTASACGDPTGAVPGRGCLHARCVQTDLGYDSAENYGISSVTVLSWWSMSLFMQFIDGCGCPCACRDSGALAGGAPDSVHRRSWWTFQFQRRGFYEG